MDEYKKIFTSDLSEVELFKAMGDKVSLIKEHIKIETIKFARGLFNEAFKNAVGRSAWDE